jgi:hypothetical protein
MAIAHETVSAQSAEPTIMRYELSDSEWSILRGMLPNKSRGVARVDDRRVLNGIFWVLRVALTGCFNHVRFSLHK